MQNFKSDIKLHYDNTEQLCDWTLSQGDLETGDDLTSSVFISLFTDRQAENTWTKTDKKGWWANPNLGSRLWQLNYIPVTNNASYTERAKSFCDEALQWLLDENIAKSVDCTCTLQNKTTLIISIVITKQDNLTLKYEYAWKL